MEAKDTVMSPKELSEHHLPDYPHTLREMKQALAEAQAEISFKAGIKEVVDKGWIIENDDEVLLEKGDFIIKGGQAKLKEWGLVA